MKRNGMCPICYVKRLFTPHSDVSEIYTHKPYGNGMALTPPMGWSSWNAFKNRIDQQLIYDTAVAMKEKGLLQAGYGFVNIDDNWVDNRRDENGEMRGDPLTFPDGIPALIEKINALGIKVGIYSSNGTATCEDLTASQYNEWTDAYTFAKWGVEYFKYDFCHNVPLSKYAPLVYAVTVSRSGYGKTYDCCDAKLSGLARPMKTSKTQSGKYVSGLDRREGSILFDNIEATEEGEYVLTIHIVKKGRYEKCLLIEVNGEDRQYLIFPSQKYYNNTAKFSVRVNLKKGINSIKLFNPIATRADSAMLIYTHMGEMLKKATAKVAEEKGLSEKPITYSLCEWGRNKPYKWAASASNLWRTTGDIMPRWWRIMMIYNHNVKLYPYAKIGGWNDPDMLEVGNGDLTMDENISHFSLWCMMCAPLILGNDLRKIPDEVLKIITNKNLISINQDKLGIQAKRILRRRGIEILVKPLSEGTAVCIFNKANTSKKMSLKIDKIVEDGYGNLCLKQKYSVTNQWMDEFNPETDEIKVNLRPHASEVYIVK